MSNLNSITVSGLVVSDLFFNHENTNFQQAINQGEYSNADIEAAVLKDAESFSELIGGQISAEDLAEDFLNRL